jgi:hypothetical protein
LQGHQKLGKVKTMTIRTIMDLVELALHLELRPLPLHLHITHMGILAHQQLFRMAIISNISKPLSSIIRD